jgi:hypothetical protein
MQIPGEGCTAAFGSESLKVVGPGLIFRDSAIKNFYQPQALFYRIQCADLSCVWGNRSDQVAQFQYDTLNHWRDMVKILEIPEAGSMVHE